VNDTRVIPPYDDAQHIHGGPAAETTDSTRPPGMRDARSDMGTSDAADAFRAADAGAASQLSVRDQDILAFERQWWKYAGAKEQAIRELFDMSATRYYQVLNALLDRPEALAADPMLVKRLRRLRSARQRARSARRLGIEV
jgi:hypothetical protein